VNQNRTGSMAEGLESQARVPLIFASVAGGRPPLLTHFARVCYNKDIRAGEEKTRGVWGQGPRTRFKEDDICQLRTTRAVRTTQVDSKREGGNLNCTAKVDLACFNKVREFLLRSRGRKMNVF